MEGEALSFDERDVEVQVARTPGMPPDMRLTHIPTGLAVVGAMTGKSSEYLTRLVAMAELQHLVTQWEATA